MRLLTPRYLLVLSLTATLAVAQGDDCNDPMPVTVGSYGPFTNVGSTTSVPAWPCALGGSDVWFVARANAVGTATFDTCGSGFDTCLEVFDGTNGCGNLASLGCNDDFCGTRSSLTVSVTAGLLLYVRVGGYSGATGTFVLNVAGDLGVATGFAASTNYGSGCYDSRASFYEFFTDPANFDLSNSGFTMLPSSGGYIVLPAPTAFVPPTASASVLNLGDDTFETKSLTTPFPYGGTSTANLTAYSNGFVATGPNNATVGTIITTRFFNEPDAAWRNWHDYDPSAGGQVTFEEIGGTAYFTWTNVPDYNVASSASTFQFQFDCLTGSVTYVFQQMSLTGGGGGGNGHMVGYSPGGASLQPDMIDISAALPATFEVQAFDSYELTLDASARPVLGATLTLDTGNVPATAAIAAQVYGLTQINPGLDLAALGMAGCRQYLSLDASIVMIPSGGMASATLSIPNAAAAAGIHIYAQSAALAPGTNTRGVVTSNGVDLRIDAN